MTAVPAKMRRTRGNPNFERSVTCPSCGKVGYIDKRQAKARIRAMEHRDGRLNAYRCPEQPDLWHIGHQPPELTAGEIARVELKPRNPNRRKTS